jgi:hypothetical protein
MVYSLRPLRQSFLKDEPQRTQRRRKGREELPSPAAKLMHQMGKKISHLSAVAEVGTQALLFLVEL